MSGWRLLKRGTIGFNLGAARTGGTCCRCGAALVEVVALNAGSELRAYCVPHRRADLGYTPEERAQAARNQGSLF